MNKTYKRSRKNKRKVYSKKRRYTALVPKTRNAVNKTAKFTIKKSRSILKSANKTIRQLYKNIDKRVARAIKTLSK